PRELNEAKAVAREKGHFAGEVPFATLVRRSPARSFRGNSPSAIVHAVPELIWGKSAEMNGEAVSNGQAPFGRRILMYAVMLAFGFICIEIVSFAAITRITSGVFYDPSRVTQNYDEYLKKRDINLGWVWPPPAPSGQNTAADGARHDPVFPFDARP